MMKMLTAWFLAVMAFAICPAPTIANPTDTIRAQVIYVSDQAVYFNVGEDQGTDD